MSTRCFHMFVVYAVNRWGLCFLQFNATGLIHREKDAIPHENNPKWQESTESARDCDWYKGDEGENRCFSEKHLPAGWERWDWHQSSKEINTELKDARTAVRAVRRWWLQLLPLSLFWETQGDTTLTKSEKRSSKPHVTFVRGRRSRRMVPETMHRKQAVLSSEGHTYAHIHERTHTHTHTHICTHTHTLTHTD